MHEWVKASFDHFVDLSHASDAAAAAAARERGIDIAIDLMGYTRDYRLGIFAARAAPLQVNYFDYPGTLGADYIDYLIADRTVIPAHAHRHYTENIVWLPGSYQVNDVRRAIPSRVFTRAELGLLPRSFVYACFNASFKITPDVYDAWMRILSRVPDSVLWLYADSETVRQNLLAETRRRGINPAHLVFGRRMAAADHSARLRLADILLDTLPYGAHTTASDALRPGGAGGHMHGDFFREPCRCQSAHRGRRAGIDYRYAAGV